MVKTLVVREFSSTVLDDFKKKFPAEHDNPDWNIERIEEFIKNPEYILIVGYVDQDLAGYLYGYKLPRLDNRKEFLLYEIGVAEEFRRVGVGTAMLEELKKFLIENSYNEAWVLTDKENIPATRMYEKSGAKVYSSNTTLMYEWQFK